MKIFYITLLLIWKVYLFIDYTMIRNLICLLILFVGIALSQDDGATLKTSTPVETKVKEIKDCGERVNF